MEYADGPLRFAGATYDPTSHYRGAAVFDFFKSQKLTPKLLREINSHQLLLLQSRIAGAQFLPGILDPVSDATLQHRGGFLAWRAA